MVSAILTFNINIELEKKYDIDFEGNGDIEAMNCSKVELHRKYYFFFIKQYAQTASIYDFRK